MIGTFDITLHSSCSNSHSIVEKRSRNMTITKYNYNKFNSHQQQDTDSSNSQ